VTNTQSATCFNTGYRAAIQGDAETTGNVLLLLPPFKRLYSNLVVTNTHSATCFNTGYRAAIQGDAETAGNVLLLLPPFKRLYSNLVSGFLVVCLIPLRIVDKTQNCFVRCDAVYFGRNLVTFRQNALPPSSV